MLDGCKSGVLKAPLHSTDGYSLTAVHEPLAITSEELVSIVLQEPDIVICPSFSEAVPLRDAVVFPDWVVILIAPVVELYVPLPENSKALSHGLTVTEVTLNLTTRLLPDWVIVIKNVPEQVKGPLALLPLPSHVPV